MGSRVVRDGLLESEAVLSLPPEGRWLYVSILLSADDYGLFEATPFKLAKRADVKREHILPLLTAMADADLVRLYQSDETGRRNFGFVTKFQQRLRGYRSKYPLPPRGLIFDEPQLVNEFNKLASEKSDRGPPPADRGLTVDGQRRPETETETDKHLSVFEDPSPSAQGLVVEAVASTPRSRVAACPTDELVALWHQHCAPPLQAVGVLNEARRAAISARWREVCAASGFDRAAGIEWFGWLLVERVAASGFLMGRGKPRDGGKPWRCTWDWLMRPTNFAKVIDGNYLDQKGQR